MRPTKVDLQTESERIALLNYAPPSVVINESFEIIHTRGRITPFLEFPSGHISFNILRMAHPELITELREVIQSTISKNISVSKKNIFIHENGKFITCSIQVFPIPTSLNSNERYYIIFFEKLKNSLEAQGKENAVTGRGKLKGGKNNQNSIFVKEHIFQDMQKKLSANQEFQLSLIEEYETSQEEMVSSNEELQSTNEELQSTIEELETAKEELQSARGVKYSQ